MYLQKNFNYLKQTRGLSYRDISLHADINMNTINKLSNKEAKNVRIETVVKLADYFNITLDDLVKKDLTLESS